ncbi:MAG: YhcN/YlaJ family sporulation lipoprotein [Bacillus sp. (in: Bacteria)]|nr:YhcN/YlaJ family sporulation lipoprotein [Bacillus sp. (in: firmicutes)]
MKVKSLILCGLSLLLLGACQGQDDTDPPVEGQGQYMGQNARNEDFYVEDQHTATEVANHLADLATDIPDVQRATAIVIGPYALVGVDVHGDIDQSEVGSVKYQVAVALSEDPYGAHAAVTADPDIRHRIEEMREEMAQGRPIMAIMNELAGIIGRIMPIIPGYEHLPRQDFSEEGPTESNKDQLSPGQEDELEDIQEDQSHGRMNDDGNDDQMNNERNENRNNSNENNN